MSHDHDASREERTTDLDGSAALSQNSRELCEAELAQVVGGVQKVREAAPPF